MKSVNEEKQMAIVPQELISALYEWYVEVGAPKMGKFESEQLYKKCKEYFLG